MTKPFGLSRWELRLMRCFIYSLGFIVGVVFQCSANAEEATVSQDVRCLIVGLRMAGMPDATQRAVGGMAIMYFLGRLDGTSSGEGLEDVIAQENSQ
jgi:hypothetical protein